MINKPKEYINKNTKNVEKKKPIKLDQDREFFKQQKNKTKIYMQTFL